MMQQLSSIVPPSGPFLFEKEDNLVYIVFGCVRPKLAHEVDWTMENQRAAVACLHRAIYNDEYGEITRIALDGFSNGNVDFHFGVCVEELLSEEEAKQRGLKVVPSSILIQLPNGDVVRMRIEVTEHGLFEMFAHIPFGDDVATDSDTCPSVGTIGHAVHKGVVRGISAAHVLTAYAPSNIGKRVGRRTRDGIDCSAGYTVTGQIPVTYYPVNAIPRPKESRFWNLYDFAWCDLPIADRACLEVPNVGPLHAPRDILKTGERVAFYNSSTDYMEGLVYTSVDERGFRFGDKAVFMSDGFMIDAGQDGSLVQPGACGTFVFGKSDRMVLGMIAGAGPAPNFIYVNRFPIGINWG